MKKIPTYSDVITAMAKAIAKTDTRHFDHTYLPDAKQLATAALRAFFTIVPEDQDLMMTTIISFNEPTSESMSNPNG